jgi:hypothetical protein
MTSENEVAADPLPVPPAVAAEFETMTRRLAIEVPPHLLRGVLLGYRGLRELAELLRGAQPAGSAVSAGRDGSAATAEAAGA